MNFITAFAEKKIVFTHEVFKRNVFTLIASHTYMNCDHAQQKKRAIIKSID